MTSATKHYNRLFEPVTVAGLTLKNRIVMAPMTRAHAPGGIVTADNVNYYERRAQNDIGLVITEGTWIPHQTASNDSAVPKFYTKEALDGWKLVIDRVHAAGAAIMPQLWHTGMVRKVSSPSIDNPDVPSIGPSGLAFEKAGVPNPTLTTSPMTDAQISDVSDAFGKAAVNAMALGADGIELHAAHGYLIDQFFWKITNHRSDRYGGDIRARAQFAIEIIQQCRRQTRSDFPISLRFSQWKVADYNARLFNSPNELECFLAPLVDAGISIFHCSTRRYWDPAFGGSDLPLAAWTRKISGKPTIMVGAVGLDRMYESRQFETSDYIARPASLDRVLDMLDKRQVDLVAVGRALLVDHQWARKIRQQALTEIKSFTPAARTIFY
jgi:2,4-dienoyl-CoA reductase-like NADH-dependent reductase (Old Yellow Enzyme family)